MSIVRYALIMKECREMEKVFFCRMCGTLYLQGRPFICDNCNSNVLIEEMDLTNKEIENCKKIKTIKIVDEVRNTYKGV